MHGGFGAVDGLGEDGETDKKESANERDEEFKYRIVVSPGRCQRE